MVASLPELMPNVRMRDCFNGPVPAGRIKRLGIRRHHVCGKSDLEHPNEFTQRFAHADLAEWTNVVKLRHVKFIGAMGVAIAGGGKPFAPRVCSAIDMPDL
jgi:hypothetical protein